MPLIDGVPLVDIVNAYESANGYVHPLEYAGLPLSADFGPKDIRGTFGAFLPESGTEPYFVNLLECSCGESGCFPLWAIITLCGNQVRWAKFTQPLREWDYDAFGPFLFDRGQYEKSLSRMLLQVERLLAGK